MKKILCLLSVTLLLLSSCSNDKNESSNLEESVFVKEIAVNYNGKTITQKFSYDKNKIKSITFQDGEKTNYTYSDNVITKIEDLDANGKLFSTMEYKYSNGKIYSCLRIEYDFGPQYKNLTKYIYNEDGTVSYQIYKVNALNGAEQEKDLISGKLFIKEGNIVKEEYYSNSVLEISTLYEYDNKNDSFKNILGYNLLLNLMPSVNNIIKSTKTTKDVFIGTTINLYEYNSKGYPTTKMVDIVNGKPFSTVKYQY
ncbi:hypothetical protein [Flavobacterium sp. CSZ]|uniref:hypothetical protein n=1 Tax=Flavobacterium sp. CSZ TaxID=2783791 RepID=UPI00188A2DD9|nr:hypothetical protein [Flavobacterium sp. CSZ]MBF4484963.1 hypothetical protein [Flavobacterium sp. CSZ]